MSNDDDIFEHFPRKVLPIPIARSKLFSALADELKAGSEKLDGKRVLSLSELGNCSDDELKVIVPIILPNTNISTKNGYVVGKSSMTGKSYRMFSTSSPAHFVLNLFNGNNTLASISLELANETNRSLEHSFAYTRGVFLSLVIAGLCVPRE